MHHQQKDRAAARHLQGRGGAGSGNGGGSGSPEGGNNDDNSNTETKVDERREEEGRLQWSWVGSRSPLMGSQEEAEWILERLTMRLQAELRVVQKEEQEGETKGKGSSGIEDIRTVPPR